MSVMSTPRYIAPYRPSDNATSRAAGRIVPMAAPRSPVLSALSSFAFIALRSLGLALMSAGVMVLLVIVAALLLTIMDGVAHVFGLASGCLL